MLIYKIGTSRHFEAERVVPIEVVVRCLCTIEDLECSTRFVQCHSVCPRILGLQHILTCSNAVNLEAVERVADYLPEVIASLNCTLSIIKGIVSNIVNILVFNTDTTLIMIERILGFIAVHIQCHDGSAFYCCAIREGKVEVRSVKVNRFVSSNIT